jgi:pimeloyl-ACP methyl ester carboxylesterase
MKVRRAAKQQLALVNGGVLKEISYKVPGVGQQTAYWLPPAKDIFETCVSADGRKEDSVSGKTFRLWMAYGGNAGLALDWATFGADHMSRNRNEQISFFLVDYPGYGKNSGAPSPESILLETELALNALDQKLHNYFSMKTSPCRPPRGRSLYKLSFVGHSLGAAAALQYGAKVAGTKWHVDRFVLVSPFTSMYEMTKLVVGPLPFVRYLLRHDFDNLDKLKELAKCSACRDDENRKREFDRVGIKLSVIHGTNDEICPEKMGKEIIQYATMNFRTVLSPRYVPIPGGRHNSIINSAKEAIMTEMMRS